MSAVAIFWFRRDLRLHDNKALYYALKENDNVLPLFIFDENIIDILPADDHRVSFIYDTLNGINDHLGQYGSGLHAERGNPHEVLEALCARIPVQAVYCNVDHEPMAGIATKKPAGFLNGRGLLSGNIPTTSSWSPARC